MNATAAKRAPPLRRRDEAKALFRNAILEAAEEVFAARGFHGARIQDIAEQARIAVGTLYNHFEQKEDVLHALIEERTQAFLDQLAPAAGDPAAFEASLTARVARWLRYAEQHRSFFMVAADHGLFSKAPAAAQSVLGARQLRHLDRFRDVFRGIIDEGVAAGAIDAIDPERLMWAFGGIVQSFTLNAITAGAFRVDDDAAMIVRLFLHGAARGSRPRRSR